jgi:3-hydroxyisobutyrate dehydrogenase-like beta-hydroxyacid dehydrogenase
MDNNESDDRDQETWTVTVAAPPSETRRRAVVALLHPGAMGARIGAQLVRAGDEVRWLSAGRSTATRKRAEEAGLVASVDLMALLEDAEIVMSVCPPQGALEVAGLVASAGFAGTYVDANPVAPGTLAEIAARVRAPGATFVDGGIVGPPPSEGNRTHLYLAGDPSAVAVVVDRFTGTDVTPMVVGTGLGAASAAKQAYALYNKGRMLLAAAAADLAEAHGVMDVLSAESGRSGADILGELAAVRAGLAEVGWRWGPEFEQIAATLEAAGTDPALARACELLLRRYQV